MDRLHFIGMTAAKQTELAQTTNANNLANASTAGFRGDFQALLSRDVEGPGMATRANAVVEESTTDFSSGPVNPTGRELDVAIRGEGWFVIQTPQGDQALSRRGDFQLTSDGQMLDGAGNPIMGDQGPVAIPDHQSLTIGDDGTISIVPLGLGAESQVTVDRIRLVNADPQNLFKGEDGHIRTRDGSEPEVDAGVRISTGNLEGANVNTVDAMVTMIALARQFEMQVKVMSTANQIDETGAKLLRLE